MGKFEGKKGKGDSVFLRHAGVSNKHPVVGICYFFSKFWSVESQRFSLIFRLLPFIALGYPLELDGETLLLKTSYS